MAQEESVTEFSDFLRGAPRMLIESAKLWWKEGKLGLLLVALFVLGVVFFSWKA